MPKTLSFSSPIASLRKAALAYPETREDHPWGESAFKVKDWLEESFGAVAPKRVSAALAKKPGPTSVRSRR